MMLEIESEYFTVKYKIGDTWSWVKPCEDGWRDSETSYDLAPMHVVAWLAYAYSGSPLCYPDQVVIQRGDKVKVV